jgi:hypothetical protein
MAPQVLEALSGLTQSMSNEWFKQAGGWRGRMARWDWCAVGLACLGAGLRWWLVLGGGQDWFPDEKRFWWSGLVVYWFHEGHWRQALEPILEWNQHPGFTCLGCLPVALHFAWAGWHGVACAEVPFDETVRFSAAVLSLASVISMVLVRSIVLRAGGSLLEARLAMALMAGSNTMFYYARHVLPYDASLALALASLAVGMRAGGRWRLVLSGCLAGAAFMTYYGYWAIVVVISVAVVTWKTTTITQVGRRAAWFIAGSLAWLAALVIGRFAVFGGSFLQGMMSFAGTVKKGAFAEGWSLPWAYLWHAEHALLICWLAAIAAVLCAVARRRYVAGYAIAWVWMTGAVYLLLVLSSVALHQFVVYGRTARQLVPFLCMIGGVGGARLWEIARANAKRWIIELGVLALVIQSAWNFRLPLRQWFPADVKRLVAAEYGGFSQALTVEGPIIKDEQATSPIAGSTTRYVLLNAQYLAPVRGEKATPSGRVVLRFSHPTQFIPHQYEEFTPRERRILRQTDISIRLIDVGEGTGSANR